MTEQHRSSRPSRSDQIGLHVLVLLAVGLLLICIRGAWADRKPCEKFARELQNGGTAAGSISTGTSSNPADSPNGYLMLRVANEACRGRPVYAGLTWLGDLPATGDQCVRGSLLPGKHQVRIACTSGMKEFSVDIVSGRTYRIGLDDGPQVNEQRPLFTVRVDQQQVSQFPSTIMDQLLELAEEEVGDSMELIDPSGKVESIAEQDIGPLLRSIDAPCDPEDLRKRSPQFVLFLQAMAPANPAEAYRFGARVYNPALGALEPAAEVSTITGNGEGCAGRLDAALLQCVIGKAMSAAKTRSHSCLRIHVQPRTASVSIRPVSGDGAVAFEPLLPQNSTQAGENGYVERAVFAGDQNPLRYSVRVEAPHFVSVQEDVQLLRGSATVGKATLEPHRNELGRPKGRVGLGTAAIVGGFLVGGFGVGALAWDGQRTELEGVGSGTFHTNKIGVGLLISGLALTAAGTVLIAVPQKKRPAGPASRILIVPAASAP